MNFDGFVKDIETNHWNVYGVEVYKDGQLIHRYGDCTRNRYPIYSATKTIVAIAAGMAVDEGKLNLHKSILEYLPESVVKKLSKEQKESYTHITTHRLLTMSVCGYPFRPDGDNWLENVLTYETPEPEKKEFDYSNVSAYLVGVVTSCALGEDLYEYLERKLFAPLKIEKPPFERSPEGYFYGASKMQLTVNELSKVGLLLYNHGIYDGQRLLSEAYIKEATSIQQMNREGGYGYFVWKYRDGYSINGKWKQKCYILPEEKIVVTYLAHIDDDRCTIRKSMEKYILGAEV